MLSTDVLCKIESERSIKCYTTKLNRNSVFNGSRVKFASSQCQRDMPISSNKLQVLLKPFTVWVECKSVLVLVQNKLICESLCNVISVFLTTQNGGTYHRNIQSLGSQYTNSQTVSYFLVSLPGTSSCRVSLLLFFTLGLLSSSMMMVSPDLMFRLRRVANGL